MAKITMGASADRRTTLKSKLVSELPGETMRELTAPATDADGRVWPAGTRYQPLCGGHDAAAMCRYNDVTIVSGDPKRVKFFLA